MMFQTLDAAKRAALLLSLGCFVFATPADAQVVCEKVKKPGVFKLRGSCKDGKEIQVVDLAELANAEPVPQTRLFGARGGLDSIGATPELVRLDGNVESFTFETTAPSTDLHITFSAECAMVSDLIGAQTQVTLLLDGVAIEPTEGDDDAFCSNTNDLIPTGITASRTVVVADVGPGEHVFQVEASTEEDGVAINETSTSILAVER